MSDFLSAISSFLSTGLHAIKQMIMAPIYLIEMVVSASNTINIALAYVPTELYIFFTAVVAVSIIYIILNR